MALILTLRIVYRLLCRTSERDHHWCKPLLEWTDVDCCICCWCGWWWWLAAADARTAGCHHSGVTGRGGAGCIWRRGCSNALHRTADHSTCYHHDRSSDGQRRCQLLAAQLVDRVSVRNLLVFLPCSVSPLIARNCPYRLFFMWND